MQKMISAHWHDHTELIFVRDGKGIFLVDGKCVDFSKNDILVITPFTIHSAHSEEGFILDTEKIAVEENHKQYLPILNARQNSPCKVSPADKDYAEFSDVAKKLFCCKNSADIACLLELIKNKNLVKIAPDHANKRHSFAVKRMLEKIFTDYAVPFNIEKTADELNLSVFYLMRIFKKFTGQSIVDFVTQYRLGVAIKLLCSGNISINQIAKNVGFCNVSFFNRQFKKLYGMTPTEYLIKNRPICNKIQ